MAAFAFALVSRTESRPSEAPRLSPRLMLPMRRVELFGIESSRIEFRADLDVRIFLSEHHFIITVYFHARGNHSFTILTVVHESRVRYLARIALIRLKEANKQQALFLDRELL